MAQIRLAENPWWWLWCVVVVVVVVVAVAVAVAVAVVVVVVVVAVVVVDEDDDIFESFLELWLLLILFDIFLNAAYFSWGRKLSNAVFRSWNIENMTEFADTKNWGDFCSK